MRPRAARALAAAAVLLPLLFASGCKSNNTPAKLVGTWESTAAPASAPGLHITLVFKSDDTVAITYTGNGMTKAVTAKYHCMWGNSVVFDNFSEPLNGQTMLQDDITILEPEMTLVDPDGTTVKLRRTR
jgi:hypothetical protein